MTAEAASRRIDGVVGAGTAVPALAIAAGLGAPWLQAVAAAAVLGWIAWRDARSFTIPNVASLVVAVLGLAVRLAAEPVSPTFLASLALDVALTGGLLWLVREGFFRLRGHDGLGMGDVKLAAAAGCLIGAFGFSVALLAACAAGLALAALRGASRADRLPLGALLAPAIWTVWAVAGFASPAAFG